VRVIAGAAGGRRLKDPPRGVRATSDLVRGAIFDALAAQDTDLSRVLDLYAGSGALGIEALSRGAEHCDFVERNTAAAAVIAENLRKLGLQDQAKVHKLAVARAGERLHGPYSLVLADPPYDDEAAPAAVAAVAGSSLVAPDATLVLELSSRNEAPETLGPLRIVWSRKHGDTQVAIYRRA
jgi:16S rRNA (guanine966-N2)-methyltransferase